MFDRVRYEPRRLLLAGGMLAGLVVVAVIVVVAVHLSGGSTVPAPHRPAAAGQTTTTLSSKAGSAATDSPSPLPSASLASDAARWDARPAVAPSVSSAFPAVPGSDRRDASSYARAFATGLFTRDYRAATRAQLLAWAQYEDAPLRSPNYPPADWTKVLADSLTDLTWDSAQDTPIPADGPWLALRTEHARDDVSDIRVSLDPVWEQRIASGYQPPDPLATERDVSLTVTRHTDLAGRATTTRFAVSIALQLGTATHGGGYGVAATNNYVIEKVD